MFLTRLNVRLNVHICCFVHVLRGITNMCHDSFVCTCDLPHSRAWHHLLGTYSGLVKCFMTWLIRVWVSLHIFWTILTCVGSFDSHMYRSVLVYLTCTYCSHTGTYCSHICSHIALFSYTFWSLLTRVPHLNILFCVYVCLLVCVYIYMYVRVEMCICI